MRYPANMSERHSAPPFNPAAASSSGGGCLSGFLMPPLAVLIVGGILAFFALGSFNSPTSAETSNLVNATGKGSQRLAISPVFTAEVQYWSIKILAWVSTTGLDPNLAATVMQMESCGDPLARSHAGAMGLFQVMPYHFASGEDPYNPDTNALRGMNYLRRSLEAASGDTRLALAGYNGGIGMISKPEYTWTGETQYYASQGNLIYQDAISGSKTSPHLQEWLTAKGAALCRQAHDRLGISP
jgi:soluble lytic murein transglycosylase-like protein